MCILNAGWVALVSSSDKSFMTCFTDWVGRSLLVSMHALNACLQLQLTCWRATVPDAGHIRPLIVAVVDEVMGAEQGPLPSRFQGRAPWNRAGEQSWEVAVAKYSGLRFARTAQGSYSYHYYPY